jgi:16S rRNA (uracil1498-N3)-methyltransferase
MRLTRVFVAEALAGRDTITLPEGPAGHLTRVLRLATGATLRVFDGHGGEYDATLCAIAKRSVTLALGVHHAIERESPLRLTLLQGISRGERMDLIVQKATELGVTRLRPLRAQRSNVKLDADGGERKLAHWAGISISACEQSGRNTLPLLLPPLPVADACAADDSGLQLLLAVDGAQPLPQLLREAGPAALARGITLLIGPEGGLDDAEEAAARRAGFRSCLLGPRVLRTETAPLAALATLQALAGDFG